MSEKNHPSNYQIDPESGVEKEHFLEERERGEEEGFKLLPSASHTLLLLPPFLL